MSSNNNRSVNLDIVRILAAFMVLAVHVGYQFPWITKYTWTGYYGVMLFFSLSGYLSMLSLERHSVTEYYKNRVLRIVPLYWSVLIIIWILKLINYLCANFDGKLSMGSPWSISYLRYFFFLNMFIPSDDFDKWNNMTGFWTMSAFAFFYLFAPVIYKLVRKYYIAIIILIVLLFARNPFTAWIESVLNNSPKSFSSTYDFSQWMPLSVFYCFFLGVTVYYACKEKRAYSFVLLCVIAMVYNEFKWYAWDLVMALLVLAAVELPPIINQGKLLDITKLLASFSFALYLTHLTVLGYIMKLQDVMVPYIRHKGFLIFTVIICIAVGYLTWKYIEPPAEALMKRMLRINTDKKEKNP